jgi:predicted nucleotidyltransferase
VSGFEAAARRIVADLAALGVRFALVGGFAVSVRTEPRFTQDVDLAVAVDDDAAAEALIRSLLGRGYELLAVVEHEAAHRLATARLTLPGSEQVTDLLFALKLLACDDKTRPQDAVDLRALIDAAGNDQLTLADEAIAAIHRRGYDRGRNIREALTCLVAEHGADGTPPATPR